MQPRFYRRVVAAALSLTALAFSASAQKDNKKDRDKKDVSPSEMKKRTSVPLAPVASPSTSTARVTAAAPTITAAALAPVAAAVPRDMKLLVLSVNGTEPGLEALKFFLDYIGTPYDVVMTLTQPLPALFDASRGYYQGIILATGNLGVCDPTCRSALSAADWTRMDNYMKDYGVRAVAYYAFPEPRFGLTFTGTAISTTEAVPAFATFTAASSPVFGYLNRANPLEIVNSYLYLASSTPALGETTTPLMTVQGGVVAALHTKADGREYLALTVDNNPYLTHSMALNYGIFNWVTKGIFIGAKRTYLMPQNDDLFLANDLFVFGTSACMPTGFVIDPTEDPSINCPTARMNGADLDAIRNWQNGVRGKAQFKDFRVSMVFNGFGASFDNNGRPNESLTQKAADLRNDFFWVNHTFTHENLDCYNPVLNSHICTPANVFESLKEIADNVSTATKLGLPLDRTSMVTPGISGLLNPAFISAAKTSGIRYFVGDTSRPEGQPASPNTGIVSTIDPAMFVIPRRATNIFYNTRSGATGVAGSMPDEYNYFFGPQGLFRVNGQPFFNVNQTWAQIVDRESDFLLMYLLRGEIYPVMFHQANFDRYSGGKTLFTDVIDAALNKFSRISTVPVASLQQSDVGVAMKDRMAFNSSRVRATLTPGVRIEFTGALNAAKVPVTGICKTGCVQYGGQAQSQIQVSAGGLTQVALP